MALFSLVCDGCVDISVSIHDAEVTTDRLPGSEDILRFKATPITHVELAKPHKKPICVNLAL
jgi:hypothetical protein